MMHGGQPNLAAVLAALTDDELAELEANWPHQDNLTDAQHAVWLLSAYTQRHYFDSIDLDPFLG